VTSLFGRTAGRKTASHFSWPVLRGLILLLMLASLAACGVKNQLVKPDGKPTPRSERDPSQPPQPTGR